MRQTVVPIANVCIDVMANTREFTFTAPFNCQIAELHTAADAASTSDYATVSVVNSAGTTIITGSAIQAADTQVDTVGVDNGQVPFIAQGALFKVVVTATGTAANVKGVRATLWADRKR